MSGAYVLTFLVYAVVSHHAFYVMTPDQFATTLSGAFAPLAFLWLVLGFMQQGEELRHSAAALRLQGEELRNSVEQQAQLVGVTREQLDFERQQLEAQKEEARRRAQPDLTLIAAGWHTAPDGFAVFEFRLLNRGATCVDLKARIGEQLVAQVPMLPGGAEHHFTIYLQRDAPTGEMPMRIEYIDALSNAGVVTFMLLAKTEGDRTVLRTL